METSQSVVDLVAVARADAKVIEDRLAEILNFSDEDAKTGAQAKNLRTAIEALESAAIDIFTLFEARMQHHFKRGPFSRKLEGLLLKSDQTDLADRVHQYYLAINVLKHGKGASYRELLNTPTPLFVVKPAQKAGADELEDSAGLIDVGVTGFFDGLTATILDAYHFLENKK